MASYDDFLRARNSKAADAAPADIERLCVLIAEFPGMGRKMPGTKLRYHVTRKYLYRVVYRAEEGEVRVAEVLHPSADGRRG